MLLFSVEGLVFGTLFGALIGLVPFAVGRSNGQRDLGKIGFLSCCAGGAFLGLLLALPLAIVFTALILVKRTGGQGICSGSSPQIMCLTGPMAGQIFPVGSEGLILGRDPCCSLRLPGSADSVSRRHCAIRWQGGNLVLEDLQSSYGTYLTSGQRLVPNQPVTLTTGSRFYLGSRQYQFQFTM